MTTILLTDNQKNTIESKLQIVEQMRHQLNIQEQALVDLINFNASEPVGNIKSIRFDGNDLIVE